MLIEYSPKKFSSAEFVSKIKTWKREGNAENDQVYEHFLGQTGYYEFRVVFTKSEIELKDNSLPVSERLAVTKYSV